MLPLHDIKSLLGRIVFKKQNHDIMLENVVWCIDIISNSFATNTVYIG
jgi:hypothetical protein